MQPYQPNMQSLDYSQNFYYPPEFIEDDQIINNNPTVQEYVNERPKKQNKKPVKYLRSKASGIKKKEIKSSNEKKLSNREILAIQKQMLQSYPTKESSNREVLKEPSEAPTQIYDYQRCYLSYENPTLFKEKIQRVASKILIDSDTSVIGLFIGHSQNMMNVLPILEHLNGCKWFTLGNEITDRDDHINLSISEESTYLGGFTKLFHKVIVDKEIAFSQRNIWEDLKKIISFHQPPQGFELYVPFIPKFNVTNEIGATTQISPEKSLITYTESLQNELRQHSVNDWDWRLPSIELIKNQTFEFLTKEFQNFKNISLIQIESESSLTTDYWYIQG